MSKEKAGNTLYFQNEATGTKVEDTKYLIVSLVLLFSFSKEKRRVLQPSISSSSMDNA